MLFYLFLLFIFILPFIFVVFSFRIDYVKDADDCHQNANEAVECFLYWATNSMQSKSSPTKNDNGNGQTTFQTAATTTTRTTFVTSGHQLHEQAIDIGQTHNQRSIVVWHSSIFGVDDAAFADFGRRQHSKWQQFCSCFFFVLFFLPLSCWLCIPSKIYEYMHIVCP